jgi:hypothetical protein
VLVLLSANPGWTEAINGQERKLKGQGADDGPIDFERYEEYRTRFFPRWYEIVKRVHPSKGMWWNLALNFLHQVAGFPHRPRMCDRDPRLAVVGWELWPLHSTSDGLSAAMKKVPLLKEFARASLAAAIRFPSDGVVIASSAGFTLVDDLDPSGKGLRLVQRGEIGGIQVRRYAHEVTGREISVIRRQLFADLVPAATRRDLAAWVQTGALPDESSSRPAGPPRLTNRELRALVTAALGEGCSCMNGGLRPCPENWHTWRRHGAAAYAFVWKPDEAEGTLHLNLPAGCIDDFVADRERRASDLEFIEGDGRNPRFIRYQARPLATDGHRDFLRHWLPKTRE